VLVVSEENGFISVGHKGHLIQNLDEDQLRRFLSGLLLHPGKRVNRLVKISDWIAQVLKINRYKKK